ncbi:hypothetical protein L208DRAFT_33533 [Tricholoma matsutake]|nr:hypothetical protein L208DRAFT_33533 [Tricholoma matsutake 945]
MRETCVVARRCRHWHRPVMSQFQVSELELSAHCPQLGHPSLGPLQTTFVPGVPAESCRYSPRGPIPFINILSTSIKG